MIHEYVCEDCKTVLEPTDINDHRGTHGPVTNITRRDLYEQRHGKVEDDE